MTDFDRQLKEFMLKQLGGEIGVKRRYLADLIAEFERNGTTVGDAIAILWEKNLFGMFKLLSVKEFSEMLTGEGESDLEAAFARLESGDWSPPQDLIWPSKGEDQPLPKLPLDEPKKEDGFTPQVINRTQIHKRIIDFVAANPWCMVNAIVTGLNLPERVITRELAELTKKKQLRSQQLRDGLAYHCA